MVRLGVAAVEPPLPESPPADQPNFTPHRAAVAIEATALLSIATALLPPAGQPRVAGVSCAKRERVWGLLFFGDDISKAQRRVLLLSLLKKKKLKIASHIPYFTQ